MAIFDALKNPNKRKAWTSHLMPLWSTVLLALIQITGSILMESTAAKTLVLPCHTDTALTLGFSLFSFWMWAILANAHCGSLVSTSGKTKGSIQLRRDEIPTIIFLAVIQIFFFIAMNIPYPENATVIPWLLLGICMYFPIMVLGDPA